MQVSYVKLFTTLTDSSVWALPDHIRVIWISMLSMANARGNVHASVLGIANRARKSVAEVEEALRLFMSPDPYSRTKSDDGRRLVEIDGGWHFITWDVHQRALNAEAARESKRKWWNENRATATEMPAELDKPRTRESTSSLALPEPIANPAENKPLAGKLDKLDSTRELGSISTSSSTLSCSRSDPDPDLTQARDRQAPTPAEAQGQRLVYRDLDGWDPPESVFEAGIEFGLTRERITARIDELRLGPIGGQRGTYDRTRYVLKLLPKWRTWDETDTYKRTRKDAPNQPNCGLTGFEGATEVR
jgi:hypothetical protein